MSKVFLSYAHSDLEVAEEIAQRLQKFGLSVWRDQSIVAGEPFVDPMEEAIKDADVVVVLLSRQSGKSDFVKREAEFALSGKKLVIPVLLDEDSTRNYVWPLLADRLGIKVDNDHSLINVAEQIVDAVRKSEEADGTANWLGRGLFSRSKLAG
ncbi:MAG: toll/interleukin-1 receptor domain-containing protein [Pseudomonadota bacterium]